VVRRSHGEQRIRSAVAMDRTNLDLLSPTPLSAARL
jgi:hypothetical protein